MRFGLLCHSTRNLGDDIQSVAAEQFLPTATPLLMDRDHLSRYKDEGDIRLIMAGWFKHYTDDWPPPSNIKPLFVGFHAGEPQMLDHKHADYYRQHEPIGCRDRFTYDGMRRLKVKAYLSGCITLTLREAYIHGGHRDDTVHVVDAPCKVLPHGFRLCREYTHTLPPDLVEQPECRLDLAKTFVERYAKASLVVTRRLHTYLPCLSLETPVLFLGETDHRFTGLLDMDVDDVAAKLSKRVQEWVDKQQ